MDLEVEGGLEVLGRVIFLSVLVTRDLGVSALVLEDGVVVDGRVVGDVVTVVTGDPWMLETTSFVISIFVSFFLSKFSTASKSALMASNAALMSSGLSSFSCFFFVWLFLSLSLLLSFPLPIRKKDRKPIPNVVLLVVRGLPWNMMVEEVVVVDANA